MSILPVYSKFFYYIDFLISIEGGFNHRIVNLDPGGATIYGVTLKSWKRHINRYLTHEFYLQDRWQKYHSIDDTGHSYFYIKKFKLNDFKALEPADVKFFYFKDYWEPCRAEDLPIGIDYYIFDFTVHSGQGNAIRTLQRVVGSIKDGVIGPRTMQAVDDYVKTNGVKRLLKELDKARRNFLSLTKAGKLWPSGMDNRLKKVMTKCYESLNEVYIDERKPLSQSRTLKAASTEAKIATGVAAVGLGAPDQSKIVNNFLPSVIDNLETVSTLSKLISTIYSYGWLIPVIVLLGFAAYHAYLKISDWFENR